MVLDISLIKSKESIEIVRKSHMNRNGINSDLDNLLVAIDLASKCNFEKNHISRIENKINKINAIRYRNRQTNTHTDNDNTRGNDNIRGNDDITNVDIYLENIQNITDTDLENMTDGQITRLSTELKELKKPLATKSEAFEKRIKNSLSKIGNILHESVPIGPDDDSNITIREQHYAPKIENCLPHYVLIDKIDGVDTKAGSRIAGNRGYFLKGACVFLAQALQNLAMKVLAEKGYTPIQTPYFMNSDIMANVAQLSQFDEELYKVKTDNSEDVGNNDETNKNKYLIATSEQPLTALHMNERLNLNKLPIKYAGVSACFRKEAGRHGKDMSGIFRVHQFEKVEQFVICSSENGESWKHMEDMLNNATEFLDILKIPYRVVNIASGELNLAAAKKYDIEGWFPGSNAYRELVSCSNCTDYHSRNLDIKHTSKTDPSGKYVHMLNSTMCAVTRMICVILENYQTEQGIIIPDALKPYMPYDIIPFTK